MNGVNDTTSIRITSTPIYYTLHTYHYISNTNSKACSSVGHLLEIGLDKVVEANEEYKFTERVGGVVKNTVEKVTEK